MIIGNPRRRSSARFFRVARRCACDATRASGDILLSGIGFKPLCRLFFMEGKERSQLILCVADSANNFAGGVELSQRNHFFANGA
jgi:hypothetical protein